MSKFFSFCVFFFISFTTVSLVIQGVAARSTPTVDHTFSSQQESYFQNFVARRDWKRVMIGSVAPKCTYNECRGCKYKCIGQQVPVEGNDPINSPYHYKCICHR